MSRETPLSSSSFSGKHSYSSSSQPSQTQEAPDRARNRNDAFRRTENRGQRRKGREGGGGRAEQLRVPGLCLVAAVPWLVSPSWLQAPYSLMTLGWLTCFRRLNSDSRSRSSFGDAFSEMHVNRAGCKPIPSGSPFKWTHTRGLHRPRYLLRHPTQGSHSSGPLSACEVVDSGALCLWGMRTPRSHHPQQISPGTASQGWAVCKGHYLPTTTIFQRKRCTVTPH